MMAEHCKDLTKDRAKGAYWERQFCKMAKDYGFMFSPMQIGRDTSAVAYYGAKYKRLTLPDVTIWTFPGQHHEIKHKNPTRSKEFGLEQYRYEALISFAETTKQPVLYTIHNHDLAGGRNVLANDIAHWQTIDVVDLKDHWRREWGNSWVNGTAQEVLIYYWPISLWQSLSEYWGRIVRESGK